MKKILIVEDEFSVALDLENQLQKLGYQVLGTADCYDDALQILNEEAPDMVLMDIHIRGEKDGIQTAQKIQESYRIPVIFLTAFGDNKTFQQAMQVEPFGYLLKPYKATDVAHTIEIALAKYQKIIEQQKQAAEQELAQTDLKEALAWTDTFFIKDKSKLTAIKVSEILWLEALDNYTIIVLPQGKVICNDYLSSLYEKLPKAYFLKVHRSYIIGLAHIKRIEYNDIFISDFPIPVSKSCKEELMQKIRVL
jgi:DNA-binding LytR/AlgR family response regulator